MPILPLAILLLSFAYLQNACNSVPAHIPNTCTYTTQEPDERCKELAPVISEVVSLLETRRESYANAKLGPCRTATEACIVFHYVLLYDDRRASIASVHAEDGRALIRGHIYPERIPEKHYAHAYTPVCDFELRTHGVTQRDFTLACTNGLLEKVMAASATFVDETLSSAGHVLNRLLLEAPRVRTDKEMAEARESRRHGVGDFAFCLILGVC